MRNAGFRTVGARDEVGHRHLVVIGTAHVAFRTAFSSLGDRHGNYSFSFRLLASSRSGNRRGSVTAPSETGAESEAGRIPLQASEHKGKMGDSSRIASRTKRSSTTSSSW